MTDPIDRQDAIDAMLKLQAEDDEAYGCHIPEGFDGERAKEALEQLPSAQTESTRTFVELVAEYPDPELCTYKEYKGKPYYSIKYIENGEAYVGYGTYNPKVLSRYLSEYFVSSAQPETCEGCKHLGKWENEVEYGYPSPCTRCKRRVEDHYER